MAVSALDSRLFRNLFGTKEVRNVFADSSYTQYMIDTEAALARAQSKVGIIPPEAGQIITEAFKTVSIE
jgi:3-carboxy-cis,cis-muconate cycloisomerase